MKRITGVMEFEEAVKLSARLCGAPPRSLEHALERKTLLRHLRPRTYEGWMAQFTPVVSGDAPTADGGLTLDGVYGEPCSSIATAVWSHQQTDTRIILMQRDESTFSARIIGEQPAASEIFRFMGHLQKLEEMDLKIRWPNPEFASGEDGHTILAAYFKPVAEMLGFKPR